LQMARDLAARASGRLPGLEALGQQGVDAAQQALGLARGSPTGRAMRGAEAQLPRPRELLGGGAAEAGAGRGLELARRYAEQAASPIANEDLYQAATPRVLQQARAGGPHAAAAGKPRRLSRTRICTKPPPGACSSRCGRGSPPAGSKPAAPAR